MHRASRLCSSRIVISAAQSPKIERLLRALRLKAFPTQSRSVEHSAPPCSSDLATEMRASRFKSHLVQYLHPASPCLFTKRARRAGRPSILAPTACTGPLDCVVRGLRVSAAQSPKVERLLRALGLKAFPVQSRPVEHSAPLFVVFGNRNEGFEVQVSCVILPCT
jgi:hypothetical protein